MTKRAAFTQSDVQRVLKGARSAGVPVDDMVCEVDLGTGKMVLRPALQRDQLAGDNPWDEVLRK